MPVNIQYHAARAEAERAMARTATCQVARIVHQKLARLHAVSAEKSADIKSLARNAGH